MQITHCTHSLKLNKMKSLLGIKSLATGMLGSRQSATTNMAMLAKYDAAKHYAGNCNAAEFEDKPIEIDEMQIDKLYQSL